MVALNLGETGEITTESASNCWSKRWAKAGAGTTPVARGRRAYLHDGRARCGTVTPPIILAAWLGAWWRVAAVYGLAPPWLDGRG